jgi:O-acetyl-ADP-ribose deacetylase (regulator of RNase III)
LRWLWKDAKLPWVFNLGTQERYWRGRASYDAIATALANMPTQADVEAIRSIAMPRIGAGYGGLSWRKVRGVIETAFAGWSGVLYVYEEYVPEQGTPKSV